MIPSKAGVGLGNGQAVRKIEMIFIRIWGQNHEDDSFLENGIRFWDKTTYLIFSEKSTFHCSLAVNRQSLPRKKCQGIFNS